MALSSRERTGNTNCDSPSAAHASRSRSIASLGSGTIVRNVFDVRVGQNFSGQHLYAACPVYAAKRKLSVPRADGEFVPEAVIHRAAWHTGLDLGETR